MDIGNSSIMSGFNSQSVIALHGYDNHKFNMQGGTERIETRTVPKSEPGTCTNSKRHRERDSTIMHEPGRAIPYGKRSLHQRADGFIQRASDCLRKESLPMIHYRSPKEEFISKLH